MSANPLSTVPSVFITFWLICFCTVLRAQSVEGNTPSVLSFGRILPNQSVEEEIKFENASPVTLEVEKIEVSSPFIVRDLRGTILPGAMGSLKIAVVNERESGPHEGILKITFRGNKRPPILLNLEAYFVPPIEFDPRPAFFVVTYQGKQKSAAIDIINHRNEPLSLTEARSESKRFTIRLDTIEPGQHYRLQLTLDGNSQPGEKREEILLFSSSPEDDTLRVQANTLIRERVYHFPNTVDMGALPIRVAINPDTASKLSQTLMVYRPETDDFTAEASVNLDYIAIISERGPEGDRYQMTLTLIPEKVSPGKIEGAVRIETNDEEFSVLEVPVTGYILEER